MVIFGFAIVFPFLLGFSDLAKGHSQLGKSAENVPQVINFKAACSDETAFRCYNGRCIPHAWLCDGSLDCPGGEDELDLSCINRDHGHCEAHKIECLTENGMRKCIPEEWKCDGYFDCVDKSDELRCPNTTQETEERSDDSRAISHILYPFNAAATVCRGFEFRCANANRCIDRELLCDGTDHCGDGSDESPGQCKVPTRIAAKEPHTTSQSPNRLRATFAFGESTSDVMRSTSTFAEKEPVTSVYSTSQRALSGGSTMPVLSWSSSSKSLAEMTSTVPPSTKPLPEATGTPESSLSTAAPRFHDEKPKNQLQPIKAFVAQPIVPVDRNTTTVVYYDPPIAGNQTEIIEEARISANRPSSSVSRARR